MAKAKKDYFGLDKTVSFILAIFLAYPLGVITRFMDGKYLAAVLRLLGAGIICWVMDCIGIYKNGRIWRVIDM